MAWASIDTEGGPWLAIGCDRAEYGLCEQIPGMNFRKSDQIWRAPLSWPAWVAFRTVWAHQPVTIYPGLAAYGEQCWRDTQRAYHMRHTLDTRDEQIALLLDEMENYPGPQPRLFVPQRGGVGWLTRMERALLCDPPGTGKTPQLIRALQVAQMLGKDALPALVICPGSALYSWQDEIANWAPELRTRVITGSALKRRRQFEDDPQSVDVWIIAWPVVRMHSRLGRYWGQSFVRCDEHGGDTGKSAAVCEVHEKELNRLGLRTVIPDEAHRACDPSSKQTRAVWWLASEARYFWPTTGTPVGDTIDDLWSPLHAIDPAAFPARSRYLDLYAIKQHHWNGGAEVLGLRPEHADAFHATVQRYLRRIPSEASASYMPDVLPPVFRYPEMSAAHRKLYRQVEKELLGDLPDGHTIVPANSGVLFGRLCQLAGSMIETDDGEDENGFTKPVVRRRLPSHKIDDLCEFLDDNPGPLVVTAFSPDLIALAERRLHEKKITTAKITGGMSHEDQDQAARFFQAGDARVIFITSAGSESITLTAASTIYYLEPEPSFFKRTQKTGRVARVTQKSPVRIVYCITKGTVDERLQALGDDKAGRADEVMRDADLMRWIVTGAEVSEPAASVQ